MKKKIVFKDYIIIGVSAVVGAAGLLLLTKSVSQLIELNECNG